MRQGSPSRASGIVLVLLSGLVSILLLLAFWIMVLTRSSIASSQSLLGLVRERIAAECGLEYAASRLALAPFPRYPAVVANRGDDWRCRGEASAPDAAFLNPSYAHGEAWIEGGGSPDAFDPLADAPGTDADGTGRFSSWSGRLRNDAKARFSLRISTEDGKVPLARGIPESADFSPVLRSLCASLGIPILPPPPNRIDPRAADWEEFVQEAAGRIFFPTASLRPFLRFGPVRNRGVRPTPYPINLWTAAPETLQALWASAKPGDCPSSASDVPGEPAGWSKANPHTGTSFRFSPLRIEPDEAARLAQLAISLREEGGLTWASIRKRLHARADLLFQEEFDALNDPPDPAPVLAWAWAAAKANLAYQTIAEDCYPWQDTGCLAAWATGGVDADPSRNGIQAPHAVSSRPLDPRCTLSPPTIFSVESLAAGPSGAGLNATVEIGDLLEFSTQEDFEGDWEIAGRAAGEETPLSRLGIAVLDDPAAPQRRGLPFPGAMASLPEWRLHGKIFTTSYIELMPSASHGALILGSQEAKLGAAQLYFPFPEDWNGFLDGERECEFDPAYVPYPNTAAWPNPPAVSPFVTSWKPDHPHAMSPSPLQILCPGWDQLPVAGYAPTLETRHQTLERFSMEAWIGPEGRLGITADSGGISLTARRGQRSPADPSMGTWFRLIANGQALHWIRERRFVPGQPLMYRWWQDIPKTQETQVSLRLFGDKTWFIADDADRGFEGSHHVLVSARRTGTGKVDPGIGIVDPFATELRLYVDGSPTDADGNDMRIDFGDAQNPDPFLQTGGLMIVNQDWELLTIEHLDEVRLHKSDIVPPRGGYGDRYVRRATFTSPLYVLDRPGGISLGQWHGIVPSSCRDGTGTPLDVFDVQVIGYLDRSGQAPAGTGDLPLSDARSLQDVPHGIRSLRYLVTIDCTAAPELLRETPVFESLWLLLRRRGQPAWLGYR